MYAQRLLEFYQFIIFCDWEKSVLKPFMLCLYNYITAQTIMTQQINHKKPLHIHTAAHPPHSTTSSNHGSSEAAPPVRAVPNSKNGPMTPPPNMVPSLVQRWVICQTRNNQGVHWLVDGRPIIQGCLRSVLMPSVRLFFWRNLVLRRWVLKMMCCGHIGDVCGGETE